MKKTIIFLILFFSSFIFKGQTPFKLKSYEGKDTIYQKNISFNSSHNLVDDTLRFNRKYKYVLKNINRFVYKEATAEQKGETLNAERPEILKGIKFPGFTTLSNVGMSPFTSKSDLFFECKKSITKDTLLYYSKELREAVSVYQDSGIVFKKFVDSFSTSSGVNKKLERLKTSVTHSWHEIDSIKKKLIFDSLGLSLQEKDPTNNINMKCDTLINKATLIYYTAIVPNAKKITKYTDSIINLYKLCLYNLSREMRCMDSCCEKTQKNKSCSQDSIFKSKEDEFKRINDYMEKLKSFSDGIKEVTKEGGSAIAEMRKAIDEGKIDIVQNNYNYLVSENFELELEPFKADKDVHEVTFTAAAEGLLIFGKPAKRTIKIKAITTGGWKIDYSTGAFYNMGSNKFLGPEYYFENRASDTSKAVIEAKRTKKAMLSIGALMHIYPRINSVIRPGFAFGVSTTLGFDVLNFHGGMSLLVGKPGKPNRVIISGGLTLREVSLLDSRFNLDVFRKDYGDTVPTSKNFPVSGGFISLTYNLLGINK